MSTIQLTDQLGLDIAVKLAPTSALLKYFKQLPSLRLDSLDLSKVGGLTLDQPAIKSLSSGLSFQEPVNIGEGAPALSVGAGAHASIQLVTDAGDLPGAEDSVDLPADACYVCFTVQATASADVSIESGVMSFGISPSTEVDLVSCTRFPLNKGITLLQALQETVGAFAVPVSCDDLTSLPAGQITKVGVSGQLTLSGTANLLAVTNPLASASLPAPLPTASVSAGGSVTIGASCTIQTEYDVVARKLDTGAVRLGWYRTHGSEVSVQVGASEGITAGIGSTDLFSRLIGVISANPKADLEELQNAGVPAGQIAGIQAAVKAAAFRKLEISVASAITASSSHEAAFLYEIDFAALTADSRAAVDRALHGDLSGLHATPLAGVTCVKTIWDDVRERDVELDVNLLGILNYRSVTSLALEGRVMYEPATGALVISDTATAERIQSTQVNFGADTQKLRHVLAESFLITAAYHGAKQVVSSVALRCSHSFFELQNSTSRADMAHKLRTGVALNLLTGSDADLPAGIANFGRTLFEASADYDDRLVQGLFLDANESPLARELYETAGRAAIQFLVQPGDEDEVRRRPAVEDDLWKRMKEVGQPSFPSLFLGVPSPFVGAITADYTTIQWWADAMHETAQQLAKVRLWMTRHPDAADDDPDFQNLRQDLAKYLRGVAKNTRNEFGDPWGLIAMNQIAGPTAPARILITGPLLVRDKRHTLAADHAANTLP